MPYTIILYPIIFIFMARLWSVSHRHGYVTTADFVRGRYDSRGLSLAVAVTGFVATMPYIALQLVGIQAVLEVVGLGGSGNGSPRTCRCSSRSRCWRRTPTPAGLRAPAVIAFVKDALIYLVIIVAVIYLPSQGRRLGRHLRRRRRTRWRPPTRRPGSRPGRSSPATGQLWAYATLALGSAMALFMYPHSVTATLSSSSRNTIRRNASILPAYSFVLGLLALLGWVAIAAGTKPVGLDGKPNPQLVDPAAVRGLLPGAGSPGSPSRPSRSARSCRRRSCRSRRPTRSPATSTRSGSTPTRPTQQEAKVSKLVSLVVKAFALVFVLTLDKQNAINFQLLGGIWILQTFPADRVQPLHALVPPVGAAGRLGGRHALRHRRGLPASSTRLTGKHFGGIARADPGASARWATSR